VQRRAAADRVPDLILDPKGLAQMLLCLLRLPRAEMERAELVMGPRLSRKVARSLGGAQERPQRPDELEPAQTEHGQTVHGAHDLQLLSEPAALVEPPDEPQQRIDLAGDQPRLEELSTGRRAEEPVGLLYPARDLGCSAFEGDDRGRLVSRLVRERTAQLLGVGVLPLSLEVRERPAGRSDLEQVAADRNRRGCRRRVIAAAHDLLLCRVPRRYASCPKRSSPGQTLQPEALFSDT